MAAPPVDGVRPRRQAGHRWWLPLGLALLVAILFPLLSGEGLGFWGAGTCHRIAEHSFIIDGRQMPLCARCSGIYAAFLTTVAVVFLRGRRRPADFPPPLIVIILLLFLAIVGLDGANSYLSLFPILPHLYDPNLLGPHTLRVVTGSLEGVALAGLLLPALHSTFWETPQPVRTIPNLRELGLILLAVALADTLLLWHPPFSFYPLSLLSLGGEMLLLAFVMTPLVAAVTMRLGRVADWPEAAALLGWGTVLALLLMAGLAWLRFALTGGSFSFTLER